MISLEEVLSILGYKDTKIIEKDLGYICILEKGLLSIPKKIISEYKDDSRLLAYVKGQIDSFNINSKIIKEKLYLFADKDGFITPEEIYWALRSINIEDLYQLFFKNPLNLNLEDVLSYFMEFKDRSFTIEYAIQIALSFGLVSKQLNLKSYNLKYKIRGESYA